MTIDTGYIGVLPARVPLRIHNNPDKGLYVASAILFNEDLLDAAKMPIGDPARTSRDDRIVSAFERATVALDDPLMPATLSEHAIVEVLLWLAELGIGFGALRPINFVDRLRTHLANEPDTIWRSKEAASAMAVSEATMRRRLAAEGTNFASLLVDVRMTHALGMLQTTDLPINRIALDVGYACPSRFARRFRARFGVAPSSIRSIRQQTMIGLAP